MINHSGRIGVILGGGPSLPEQLKNIPKDAVTFGVNHHASKLVTCDYIVFNDYHGWPLVRDLPGKKICRWHEYADIQQDCAPGVISGVLALRVALKMGLSPIILAGFDCYQGGGYFHDPAPSERAKLFTLEQHLSFWKEFTSPNIYVADGPLTTIFKQSEKDMKPDKEFIEIEICERKNVDLDDRRTVSLRPGQLTVTREIALAAIKDGCAKEIKPKKGIK